MTTATSFMKLEFYYKAADILSGLVHLSCSILIVSPPDAKLSSDAGCSRLFIADLLSFYLTKRKKSFSHV